MNLQRIWITIKIAVISSFAFIIGCGITPFQTPHVSRHGAMMGTFYAPIDSSFHWVGKAEIGHIDASTHGGVSIGFCFTDEGPYEEAKFAFMTNRLDIGGGINFQLLPGILGGFGGIGTRYRSTYVYLMYNRFTYSYDPWGGGSTDANKLTLGVQICIPEKLVGGPVPMFINIEGSEYEYNHSRGWGWALGISGRVE